MDPILQLNWQSRGMETKNDKKGEHNLAVGPVLDPIHAAPTSNEIGGAGI